MILPTTCTAHLASEHLGRHHTPTSQKRWWQQVVMRESSLSRIGMTDVQYIFLCKAEVKLKILNYPNDLLFTLLCYTGDLFRKNEKRFKPENFFQLMENKPTPNPQIKQKTKNKNQETTKPSNQTKQNLKPQT